MDESPGVEYLSSPEELWFPDEWYQLADPGHFWIRWRFGALLGQLRRVGIPRDQPLRALDIGGGTGVLRQQLEASTAWTIDVADLHPAALRATRRGRGRNLCYDVHDRHTALVGRFDVVLLFDVLEHIHDPGPFLASVLAHLTPGGHLLLNVPALQWLFSAYDVAAGHLRRYDRRSLAAELAGTGLAIRDVAYWGLLLVPLLAARKRMLRTDASRDQIIRAGFCPPGRFVEWALRVLMRVESTLAPRPPLGTSLLLAGQRRAP
jgi:SAM-dependent methyltransferase